MGYAKWFVGLMASALLGGVVCSADQPMPEYRAKVALLEKLTRFVNWPEGALSPQHPFRLAIIGRTPFGDELENYFASHPLKNRPVSIQYFTTPSEIRDCDLLFVCASEQGRLGILLATVRSRPFLIVGDTPGFAQRGLMINIVGENGRMIFEVNLGAVRESGFRMHPGFLQLVRIAAHN